MLRRTLTLIFTVLATVVALAGCAATLDPRAAVPSTTTPPPLFAQTDSPDNLKGLLDTIVKSAGAGDVKKAAALTRGLLVDRDTVFKALKDDAPTETVDRALTLSRTAPSEDATVAKAFSRGNDKRTEITVHGATTEEIAASRPGPVAKNFPGGAKTLAQQGTLRPGVTFYEVNFTEPGRTSGMQYHLFFWDGSQWRMLGPVWRSIN